MAASEGQQTKLYGTAELERVLDAMAAALANRLYGVAQITLVGVRRRGAPLSAVGLEVGTMIRETLAHVVEQKIGIRSNSQILRGRDRSDTSRFHFGHMA